MPEDKARKHAIRDRMAATGERYTAAARALDAPYRPGLISVSERMQESGGTYAEAVAFLEDPANGLLCEICGWTNAMACPECAGCGCDTRCTGWRHAEFRHDDDPDPNACEECGATSYYDCNCYDYA
jgi:hypothetical protein